MLTDEQITTLKAQHGDVLSIVQDPDGNMLVFKPPTRAVYDRWIDKGDNKQPSANARELAQACLVFPDRDGMIAMLDKRPGMLLGKNGVLDTITGMAGLFGEEGGAVSKKL